MPLQKSDRTERIITAAAHLFASQGFHGTTTREIAQLAEVSEHTLFRHFNGKKEIFWSALRSYAVGLRPTFDLLHEIQADEALDIMLPRILGPLTETVGRRPEVARLLAVALLELNDEAEAACRDLIVPLFSEMSEYMARNVQKGLVLKADPAMLTACLLSMVLLLPQISKLTDGRCPSPQNGAEAFSAYSNFWLQVLAPRIATIESESEHIG
jgi:AcrR family transcriptional regulator